VFYSRLPDPADLTTFPIVGNHDLYFDGWKKFQSLFGTTTYLFTVKTPTATDLYICLDSGSGTLGSEQLKWLKNILIDRSDYRHCILFTHTNLFRIRHTFSTNPFVEEIRELADLCVRYEIDMVVTGHDHKRNVVVFGNTVHVTMDALEDINDTPSYFKLNIIQGELSYQFIPVQ
jgi:3',5'-cyclic AMP phosphodiesterase CpdA